MLYLLLPYPPSVNSYWGFKGSMRFLTAKAKEFKKAVFVKFAEKKHKGFGTKRLQITIVLHPTDKRVRDIDNSIKSLLDALCQAGAFEDDSQVDKLIIERADIVKGGLCHVFIDEK
jgi:crossover junction endodeoxyribonuclease RusA